MLILTHHQLFWVNLQNNTSKEGLFFFIWTRCGVDENLNNWINFKELMYRSLIVQNVEREHDVISIPTQVQVGRFTYMFCYQFLMTFRCFGIFPIGRTGFLHLNNTRKKRYRAGRTNRSNRPTKVSLHWTGFKFGIYPQKHRAQLVQDAKRPCKCIL